MYFQGKKEAGISESEPLACLSLCLSGCEEKTANELLEKELRTLCPTLMERCLVHSDTMASMATVTDFGGMVLITGKLYYYNQNYNLLMYKILPGLMNMTLCKMNEIRCIIVLENRRINQN